MEKCHCSRVKFSEALEVSEREGIAIAEAGKKLDIGETCTACRTDFKEYCQRAGVRNWAEAC